MEEVKTATNYQEAMEQCLTTVSNVLNDKVNVKAAHEVSSLMGKVASLAKTKIEYAKLRKESPEIGFLNDK